MISWLRICKMYLRSVTIRKLKHVSHLLNPENILLWRILRLSPNTRPKYLQFVKSSSKNVNEIILLKFKLSRGDILWVQNKYLIYKIGSFPDASDDTLPTLEFRTKLDSHVNMVFLGRNCFVFDGVHGRTCDLEPFDPSIGRTLLYNIELVFKSANIGLQIILGKYFGRLPRRLALLVSNIFPALVLLSIIQFGTFLLS